MSKKIIKGGLVVSLLVVLPLLAVAKDKASGERMKIKNAKVIQVIPEKGTLVVKRNEAVYNIVLAFADPDKAELLSKYGVNVDPWKLEPGDHITCRGRRFPTYFVPSKCRIEKDSQKKLYKDKKGIMVADVYATDSANKLIYVAHSLNKTGLTTVKKSADATIMYKDHNVSISDLKPYWRLKIKGEWDSTNNQFKKIKYIKVLSKLKNAKPYEY